MAVADLGSSIVSVCARSGRVRRGVGPDTYDDRVTIADHCPGVLRPHRAEDGSMVRLRVPGGQTTGAVLAAVAWTARRYGNPEIQLTTRAGLQIRGLPDPVPAALVADIAAAGLLPSVTHERVRNIVASPFTGIWREDAPICAR